MNEHPMIFQKLMDIAEKTENKSLKKDVVFIAENLKTMVTDFENVMILALIMPNKQITRLIVDPLIEALERAVTMLRDPKMKPYVKQAINTFVDLGIQISKDKNL